MTDRTLAALQPIGAIDQFVDSTDVLGFRPTICRQIGRVFDAVTPAIAPNEPAGTSPPV
jgi:hypothetical protein